MIEIRDCSMKVILLLSRNPAVVVSDGIFWVQFDSPSVVGDGPVDVAFGLLRVGPVVVGGSVSSD